MTQGKEGPVRRLSAFFDPSPPRRLGVACSGGGDSLALLCLLADWSALGGPSLEVVTIDHGLRPESGDEAKEVSDKCAQMNIPHTTLRWGGWDGSGNLPDKARRARYGLMADWARQRDLSMIALGHTQDDVAEGFLMRLARGSGLDGLSEMSEMFQGEEGVRFVRPLLRWSRSELRDILVQRGLSWIDDPTNEDDRFDRVQMRKALTLMSEIGITASRIAQAAQHLRTARDELSFYIGETARDAVLFDAGDILIPLDTQVGGTESSLAERKESLRKIAQAGLLWVSGGDYAPRRDALDRLQDAVASRTNTTLCGCRVLFHNGVMRLTREWNAVADMRVPVGDVWDGRWMVQGPEQEGYEIAALGEAGLPLCPDRKATGRPAASMISSPAIWKDGQLIAAPLAGLANDWTVQLLRDEGYYFSKL